MKRMLALLVAFGLAGIPLFAQEPPAPEPQPTPPAPAVTPPATPAAAPAAVTVGEFAIRAASGLGMQAPQGGFTPESAAWSLVQKGIKVRPELDSPLTEADAVDALTRLGFSIKTMTPSRVVSRDRFEILCSSFFTQVTLPPMNEGKVEPAPLSGKQ